MTFLRQGQAACAMNMPATDGSDENAQLPGHREPDCIGIWVMKTLKTGIMLATAGGAMVAATAAEAQDWRYDDYMAHRAGRGAEIHAYQAGRDQRAADTAPIMAITAPPTPMPMPPRFGGPRHDATPALPGMSDMPHAGIIGMAEAGVTDRESAA